MTGKRNGGPRETAQRRWDCGPVAVPRSVKLTLIHEHCFRESQIDAQEQGSGVGPDLISSSFPGANQTLSPRFGSRNPHISDARDLHGNRKYIWDLAPARGYRKSFQSNSAGPVRVYEDKLELKRYNEDAEPTSFDQLRSESEFMNHTSSLSMNGTYTSKTGKAEARGSSRTRRHKNSTHLIGNLRETTATSPTAVLVDQAVYDSTLFAIEFNHPLDYAAGVAMNHEVVRPLVHEVPEDLKTEVPYLVSRHYLGNTIFIYGGVTGVLPVKVELATGNDTKQVAAWWGLDKVLSYSSWEWSELWTKRCRNPEPGCELIKLTLFTGEILGIAYLERNRTIKWCSAEDGSKEEEIIVSMIKGIRVAPPFNQEVKRRIDLFTPTRRENVEPVAFRGISSALLCHMICSSIRYGSAGVAVYSPKNEIAEEFYRQHFGLPVRINEEDGQRVYVMIHDAKWKYLRDNYRRQITVWRSQREKDKSNQIKLSAASTMASSPSIASRTEGRPRRFSP